MIALSGEHSTHKLSQVLGVSRSGCYRARGCGPQALSDQRLSEEIKRIYQQHKNRYGSPRIFMQLQDEGIMCSEKRVARLMRREGLRGLSGKRKAPKTTDSSHHGPIAPNRLKQMSVRSAHQVWVMDITYIRCGNSWAYLAAVLDLYLHKIVGWEVSETMSSALVETALKQAVTRQGMPEKVTVHSDRGSQYASSSFISLVESLGYQRSMSAKGNCYDNATMESFFGAIKREELDRWEMPTLSCVRNRIFDYIETYYNRIRIHTSIGMSPAQFEEQNRNEVRQALAGADRPPPMPELETKPAREYELTN